MQTSIPRNTGQAPHQSIDWSNPDAFRVRLAYAIKTSGIKQDALAMEMGIDPSTLSHWLGGKNDMPARMLPKLIRALGDNGLALLDEMVSQLDKSVAVMPTMEVFFAPEYIAAMLHRAFELGIEITAMAMMKSPRPVYKMRGHICGIHRLVTTSDAILDAMPADQRESMQTVLELAMRGEAV